jgi:hypothetical protein
MYNRSIEELGRGGRVEWILNLLSLLVNAKFLTITDARTGDREKKLLQRPTLLVVSAS